MYLFALAFLIKVRIGNVLNISLWPGKCWNKLCISEKVERAGLTVEWRGKKKQVAEHKSCLHHGRPQHHLILKDTGSCLLVCRETALDRYTSSL